MKKIILSLSGGMDSGTLLGDLLDNSYQVKAFSFLYGSKHNPYELAAATKLCQYFNVDHTPIDLTEAFGDIQSNLMKTGGDIPEGHYNDSTMSQTVVPGRNHIFASILAGIAESLGYDAVALAVHSGDHAIYPDCRPLFIEKLKESVQVQSENKVTVIAPYLYMDKESIIRQGLKFNMPYELTRTCYKDQPIACGKCGSCVERLEAWTKIGLRDPIQYEEK